MIKAFGIVWSVHPLFVIVMLLSVAAGRFAELLTLFALVFVHELGHVVAARAFGWTIREVKLLPFGGVAEVEEAGGMPSREEAIVALAGPLQNVWMGLLAWGLGQTGVWDAGWTQDLISANAMIVLFNLLPIHPLDGGKLLQCLLGLMMAYHRALSWTVGISIVLSLMLGLAACAYQLWPGGHIQLNLLTIAVFLLATNMTQRRHLPFLFIRFLVNRDRYAQRRIARGANASPIIVHPEEAVHSVLRLLLRDKVHLIYVTSLRGELLGVLPEYELLHGFFTSPNPNRVIGELIV
ncbi:M50 family metallopeptidase [Paenibacillus sp. MMS18-CY102]|uniref:M50 family metallopeptidase n=1 Tax=Paenibacillus sp. MMS18-CY102 TaxID=2682849 RepID=UPI00136673A0|nr:M50 family metallopeptidase [Paenibacillus sp. MMS18-CY102]MWC28758.1 Zn-dependent protease [Paenibacillus sp. MMS18-CY102]